MEQLSNRSILKIAIPLLISRLPEVLFFAISAAFLGNYQGAGLEAISAGTVCFMIIDEFSGGWVASLVQTTLSESVSKRDIQAVKKCLYSVCIIILPLSLLAFTATVTVFPAIINCTIFEQTIKDLMRVYVNCRAYGIPFVFLNYTFVAFLTAHKNTTFIPIVTIIQVSATLLFNYVLVLGHWGFAPLGIKGTAISTILSECVGFVVYFAIIFKIYNKQYRFLEVLKIKISDIKPFLDFNYAIRDTTSALFWYLFFAVVVRTGAHNAAVTSIVKSIFSLLLFSISPLKSTLITLISYDLGKQNYENIGLTYKKVGILCFVILSVTALLMGIFAVPIIKLYVNDQKTVLVPSILDTVYILCLTLPFVKAFSNLTIATLNALGERKLLRNVELFVSSLYILVAYFLAVTLHQPIHIIWLAEPFYGLLNFLILYPIFIKKINVLKDEYSKILN